MEGKLQFSGIALITPCALSPVTGSQGDNREGRTKPKFLNDAYGREKNP